MATKLEIPPLRPIMVVPDFDRVGGYERQAFYMARASIRSGIDSMLLTNNPWGNKPRELREGVRIVRLEHTPCKRETWVNLYKSFLIFLYSHRHEYDVIHCHAFTFMAAYCSLIGKILRKPVLVKVATEQDIREFHYGKGLGFRVFYPLLRQADRFLSLSEAIRTEFLNCGFPERQVVLQPNGVDSEHFHPRLRKNQREMRAKLGLEQNRFHFLYTGRLVQRKGVDLLLRSIASSRALRECKTLILGEGDEGATLRQQAADLRLGDSVEFLGEHSEVRPYLSASDAFVFPSRLEGLPNALLEALSMGLPTIATRIGGCTDVLTNGSGLLVDKDDSRGLAVQMERLVRDPDLASNLSRHGRQRILDRFSFDRVTQDLQGIYRSAWIAKES